MSVHTIHGKTLSECTKDELHAEWEGGMYLDCTVGLTAEQEAKLIAVEREMSTREEAEHATIPAQH
jgi:hypothetical protein